MTSNAPRHGVVMEYAKIYQLAFSRAMHIQSIPMCQTGQSSHFCSRNTLTHSVTGTGSSNNYAYLVKDDKTNDAVIIDPANPPEYVGIDDGRAGTSDES